MQNQLLDEVLARHRLPGESEAGLLRRLRQADGRLTRLYEQSDVSAEQAYADPLIRAAYQLRYQPHYVLQMGDLLQQLEGDEDVSDILCQPHLRHVALCGGPAPEAIALALVHHQAGGRQLHSTVLDQGAAHWCDCWPSSARLAVGFSGHARVEIDGVQTSLARLPHAQERTVLAQASVLTLMNAFNELLKIGASTLERTLGARLDALPPGALVLASDQASYTRTVQGMALLRRLLVARGARLVRARTLRTEKQEWENRFTLIPRLQGVYGQPTGPGDAGTRQYRIWNRQLELAAVLPR